MLLVLWMDLMKLIDKDVWYLQNWRCHISQYDNLKLSILRLYKWYTVLVWMYLIPGLGLQNLCSWYIFIKFYKLFAWILSIIIIYFILCFLVQA